MPEKRTSWVPQGKGKVVGLLIDDLFYFFNLRCQVSRMVHYEVGDQC